MIQTALDSYTLGAEIENLLFAGGGSFAGTGNALDNTIIGGSGDDTLTGGAGNDTFVFGAGSGQDTITDFTAGQDRIQIRDGLFANAKAALAAARQTDRDALAYPPVPGALDLENLLVSHS